MEEVDGGVEEGGLEFLLEVRVRVFGLDALDVLRDVDQGDDVDRELAEDGADDVDVEDVVLWALFGEGFDSLDIVSTDASEAMGVIYLRTGDGQEADAHHHSRDGDLAVTKLDTIEVQHREGIRRDQTV